ncbi:MAG: COX15/CtaA family protein, partial [Gemmatimonadales bacterium]
MNPNRRLGIWLTIWAAMLLLLILIGGTTRLTESGLSITEWNVVSGVVPPLNQAAWSSEFSKYRQIPQYRAIHTGMTLQQFKGIFLWEYLHRLWARLVTLAFALPLVWFVAQGLVPREVRGRLWLLLVLLGAQGALGWFMVSSGLSIRTEVSQYRLAAHFAAALLIYGTTVWTAADFLARARRSTDTDSPRARHWSWCVTALAVLTAIAGAFVAGLRAGHAYNTFPLMAGHFVPPGYAALSPWPRNLFENVAAVQFNHRCLALLTLASILAFWWWSRRQALTPVAGRAIGRLALLAMLQVALGIATLLLVVPVSLGVAHQAGAVLLLTGGILAMHALRSPRDGTGQL